MSGSDPLRVRRRCAPTALRRRRRAPQVPTQGCGHKFILPFALASQNMFEDAILFIFLPRIYANMLNSIHLKVFLLLHGKFFVCGYASPITIQNESE